MVQRTDKGTDSWGSKTDRSRRSQRMKDWENIKQKKSEGSNKIFGIIEEIYSRIQFFEKRRGPREYKGDSSRVWGEDKYRIKKTREVRHGRGKRL